MSLGHLLARMCVLSEGNHHLTSQFVNIELDPKPNSKTT